MSQRVASSDPGPSSSVIGIALAQSERLGVPAHRHPDGPVRIDGAALAAPRHRHTPDCACQQGTTRLIQLAPGAFPEIRYAGNQLRHTLTMLGAAAYRDRRRCGFQEPPWTLIGMYTRSRLLTAQRLTSSPPGARPCSRHGATTPPTDHHHHADDSVTAPITPAACRPTPQPNSGVDELPSNLRDVMDPGWS